MVVYFNGLLMGFSLTMALGPQNIFLIRQGIMRHSTLLAAVVCFICDTVLVCASVAGLHKVLALHPTLQSWIVWFGVIFLLYYGSRNLNSALKNKPMAKDKQHQTYNRWQIILLALSFSLLNPHAIIDSLVIIGSGSSQFPEHQQAFIFGVVTASLLWFSSLTLTTYYFAELLRRGYIWRCIELGSGLLMIFLSLKLASGQLKI